MALWSIWGSKHDSTTIEREVKADKSTDREPQTTTQNPDGTTTTDGTVEQKSPKSSEKPKRKTFTRNRTSLAPKSADSRSRSTSRSKYSNVTDVGQTGASTDDLVRLNSLAPPVPGLAEATRIAPERKPSNLDHGNEPSNLGVSTPGVTAPGIVVEDSSRPQSPETLIPATDTLSTRPTRGGIAYPFRLKVDGENRDVNASTLTLQSVNVETPRAEEFDEGATAGTTDNPVERAAEKDNDESKEERPGVERFFTASAGEISASKDGDAEEKEERPGMERFETAQQDLTTISNETKS